MGIGNSLKSKPNARSADDQADDMWPLTRLLYYDDEVRFDFFWRAGSTLLDYTFCMGIYQSLSMFICDELEDGTTVMRLAPWETCGSDRYYGWFPAFFFIWLLYGVIYPVSLFYYFYKNNQRTEDEDGNKIPLKDEATGERMGFLEHCKSRGKESKFFRRWGYHYVWKKSQFWWYPFYDKFRWELGISIGIFFEKYDGYQILLVQCLLLVTVISSIGIRSSGWEFYNKQNDLKESILFLILMSGIFFDTLKFYVVEWETAYEFMAYVFSVILACTWLTFCCTSMYEAKLYYGDYVAEHLLGKKKATPAAPKSLEEGIDMQVVKEPPSKAHPWEDVADPSAIVKTHPWEEVQDPTW